MNDKIANNIKEKKYLLSPRTRGVLCILLSAIGFSLMSVFIRFAGNDIPPIQKTFFRNSVTVIVIGISMLRTRTSPVPMKGNFRLLFIRSAVVTIATWANFYAIDNLILSDANMLIKFSPFAAILFSAVYLKEKPTSAQILAVIIACLGSSLVLKPGFKNAPFFASVIGLLAGIGAGVSYALVRKIGKTGECSIRIIFFSSVFACVTSLPSFLISYAPMSPKQIGMLFLAGTCGTIGQFGITKAYIYFPAKEISIYEYTQIIFATLFGFLFFDQLADIWSVLGYVLICGSGLMIFLYNRKKDLSESSV